MKQQADAGVEAFTLLEVMVAFIVLALAMGVVLQTINLSARSTAAADEKRQVMALVEELRVEKLNGATPGPDTQTGLKGQVRWELRPASNPPGSQEFESRPVGLMLLRIFPDPSSGRNYDFLLHARANAP